MRLHRARSMGLGCQIQIYDGIDNLDLRLVEPLCDMEGEQVAELLYSFMPRRTFESLQKALQNPVYQGPREEQVITGIDGIPPEQRPAFVNTFSKRFAVVVIRKPPQ